MNKISLSIICFSLFAFSAVHHNFTYLNPDNAWLLHVAQQVLAGKTLYVDIIETNPPLIIYINYIPVWLSNITGLFLPTAFNIFILLLNGLAFAYLISKHSKQYYAIIACAIISTILCANNWGEREHILITLFLPHLFAKFTGRDSNMMEGLLAAIAICIKPYFIIFWLVIEAYEVTFKNHKLTSKFNNQNIFIAISILAYSLYLTFIEQNYVNLIVPQMLANYNAYQAGAGDVLSSIATSVILFELAFILCLIFNYSLLTRQIYTTNFLFLAGVITIIIQQKVWANHFYPVNFFGVLLNALIAKELLEKFKQHNVWVKFAGILSVSVIIINLLTAAKVLTKPQNYDELVNLFNKYKTSFVFSFDLAPSFPAIMHSSSEYLGRYGHLWMLPNLYRQSIALADKPYYRKYTDMDVYEQRIYDKILADLRAKPELILVANRRYANKYSSNFEFDFVKYMQASDRFNILFKSYTKVGAIDKHDIYKLK